MGNLPIFATIFWGGFEEIGFFSYCLFFLVHWFMDPKRCWKVCFFLLCLSCFSSFSDVWRDWKSRKDQSSTKNLGGNTQIHSTISSKISTGLRTPPEMNKRPLNKGPGPRREMNHLPTINFRGRSLVFRGVHILHISYHIWIHDQICGI